MFFIPYTVDVPMKRLPIANWVLMTVTFCVSLGVWVKDSHRGRRGEFRPSPELERKIQELEDRGATDEEIQRVILQLGVETDAPTGALDPQRFSVFQLISYQFVHGDILHLAGNLLFLFVFGNAVNAKLGQPLFVGAYLLL